MTTARLIRRVLAQPRLAIGVAVTGVMVLALSPVAGAAKTSGSGHKGGLGTTTTTTAPTSTSSTTTTTAPTTTTSTTTTTTPPSGGSGGPSVSISSPTGGAVVSRTVTVTGTAADAGSAISKVEVSVDSGPWATATGTSSWSWSWDTYNTNLANGGHTLSAMVVDSTGLSSMASIGVTVSNSDYALSSCDDGTPALQRAVTPEGVQILICTTVGGWTTSSINQLLVNNATVDLGIVGPHLDVEVETGYPDGENESATCCDRAGHYYNYDSQIALNPSSSSAFSTSPDAYMAHPYGMVWAYYWYYMNPANNASWSAYDNFRWSQAGGTQVLAQNPNLNTQYIWDDFEMAADDFRRLFGDAAAQSELTYINRNVPDSQQVTGLASFLLNTWR